MGIDLKKVLILAVLSFVFICATPPKPVKKGPVIIEIITRFGTMKALLYDDTPKHRDNFVKLIKKGFFDSLTFHSVSPYLLAQGGDPQSRYATEDSVIGSTDLGYKIPAEFRPKIYHVYGALAAARDFDPSLASSPNQFFVVKGRRHTYEELTKLENYKNQKIKSDILYLLMQADSTRSRMDEFSYRGDKEGLKKYIASFQAVADSIYNARGIYRFTEDQIRVYTSVGGIPQYDSGYTVFGQVLTNLHIVDSICAQPVAKNKRPLNDIRMKIRISKN